MGKNYSSTAQAIVKLIGGESNVTHFVHCSTRLRFSVADLSKVDQAGLKATSGVKGVIVSGNQCQVVIGNDVIEVYDEIKKIANFSNDKKSQTSTAGTKKKIGSMVLDFMVGVFQPLVPAIAGGGILKAFLSLFPYVISSLGDLGYEILYNGASIAHNISEGGASLAIACKTKDPELCSAAFSSGVSAIFGKK